MSPLTRQALLQLEPLPPLRPFYGHTARADGRLSDACFSQWWPCRFELNGVAYPTAEHFMMASKARLFGDREALDAILSAPSPAKAKALGRTVRHFDGARWEACRFDVVAAGSLAKFSQSAELAAYLRATGHEVLVEASPRDRIWGVGLGRDNPLLRDPARWRGENLLGFALMHARDVLEGRRQPVAPGPWARMVGE
jgi:ribA/ribD-fused uncharacterized protein